GEKEKRKEIKSNLVDLRRMEEDEEFRVGIRRRRRHKKKREESQSGFDGSEKKSETRTPGDI
ncbi:hypothetical protein U1Q18_004999, partial [Sarracenia purpurea var. burkii]